MRKISFFHFLHDYAVERFFKRKHRMSLQSDIWRSYTILIEGSCLHVLLCKDTQRKSYAAAKMLSNFFWECPFKQNRIKQLC
jgi:hypothetical protein